MLRVASDYTQLALHALAHLPLTGPDRLLDAAYLAWAATNLPGGARDPIEREAETLAALCGQTEGAGLLQAAPELFVDIAQLRASATLELDQLSDADVAAPALLGILRGSLSEGVELWRSCVSLAAPAFASAWHEEVLPRCMDALEEVRGPLREARELHPALGDTPVELAWPLGARGRAFAQRIVVGVPGDWSSLGAEVPAVVAMNEAAVRAHRSDITDDADERSVQVEWTALVDVSERVRSASAGLRQAHAAWLASLALEPLCREAAQRGLVSSEVAAQVADRPHERAALLAP